MILDDSSLQISMFSQVCSRCAHFNDASVFDVNKSCKAFPKGIPLEIWNGRNPHLQPVEGDNGIQFKLHPEAV